MKTVRRRSLMPAGMAGVRAAGSIVGVLTLASLSPAGSWAGDQPGFDWGFQERVRQEYIENGFSLDDGIEDEWNSVRVRSQLWLSYRPAARWKFYAGLNNEHRHWFRSDRGFEDRDFEIDEFIFENLYVSAERIAGSPLSFTVGRQNIMFGEGFLFMDGGPLDGSRTGYFNAVRVKAEGKSRSLELVALSDPTFDKYLPTLNCQYKKLIEYDEKAAALYYTESSVEKMKIEAYYIFKTERSEGEGTADSDIHTVGARSSGKIAERLDFQAELAFQFGDRGGMSRKALGGCARCAYGIPVPLEPTVSAGIIHLSGDDPGTGDYEGWNPLFGRWPIWSELYIFTLAGERGIAYWDNLTAPNLALSVKPHGRITLEGSVYFMSAPSEHPEIGGPAGEIFGGGDTRGILSILKVKWSVRKYLSGHFLWERFAPGDYYRDTSDTAHFLRWEVLLTY